MFLITVLLFCQKGFEYLKNSQNREMFGITAAAMSSFAAALIMGLFDHIWYSNRIFFLFWAVIGVACAAIRVDGAGDPKENDDTTANSEVSAFVDL